MATGTRVVVVSTQREIESFADGYDGVSGPGVVLTAVFAELDMDVNESGPVLFATDTEIHFGATP